MSTTKLIGTLCFLLASCSSIAQDSLVIIDRQAKEFEPEEIVPRANNIFYLKIGIYEATIGFSKSLGSKIGLGVEVDYRARLRKEARYRSHYWLLNSTYSGFRGKLLLNAYVLRPGNSFSVVGSYRYLESGNMIYDPGKFGGSNSSDYSEFSQKNHELALLLFFNFQVKNNPSIHGYFGLGSAYRHTEKHWTVVGSYSNQITVNFTKNFTDFYPTLSFGLKFDILSF